jgi:hypothetical protein
MSSFRAEGYGKMAAATFLSQIVEWQSLDITSEIEFICDNKGLLQRGRAFANRITNAPSYYMEPDHDVIMEIKHKMEKLGRLNTRHTKKYKALYYRHSCRNPGSTPKCQDI